MENNYNSFEEPEVRCKYANDISGLLEKNNLRWKSFPSVMKAEVFIRPKDPPEEILRNVSRVSLQLKDNAINFGVSGTQPHRAREIRNILENKGYAYHDKGYTEDGRPKGRWWLVKPLYSIESLVEEFKDIESLLHERIFN